MPHRDHQYCRKEEVETKGEDVNVNEVPAPKNAKRRSSNLARTPSTSPLKSRKIEKDSSIDKFVELVHHEQVTDYFLLASIQSAAKDCNVAIRPRIKKQLFAAANIEDKDIKKYEVRVPLKTDDLPNYGNYRFLEYFFDTAVTKEVSPVQEYDKIESNEVFPLMLTSPIHIDPLEVSGGEIADLAVKSMEEKVNHVFQNKHTPLLPGLSDLHLSSLFYTEIQYMEEKLRYMGHVDLTDAVDRMRLPFAVITIRSMSDLENPNLFNLVTSLPMACVRGIGKTIETNFEVFQLQKLADTNGDLLIDVIRQLPQHYKSNIDFEQGTPTWKMLVRAESHRLERFAENYNCLIEEVKKTVERLTKQESAPKALKELRAALPGMQLKSPENVEPEVTLLSFGANIHLDDKEMFKEQWAEISFLPAFLQPNSADDLMQFAKEILPGINGIRVSVKTPGARSSAHLENGALAAINWNLGPDDCIWYAVPAEFSRKMEQLIECKNLEFYDSYWPNEEQIRQAGIPIQTFVQKPDDLVYVGMGSIHWTQSIGFTTSISWNVARATKFQLDSIAIMQDHSIFNERVPTIPIVPIIWNIAFENVFLDDDYEFHKSMKHLLARSLAYCKMELEKLKTLSINPHRLAPDDNLKPVERCATEGCRKVLFNLILKRTTAGGDTVHCIHHCSEKDEAIVRYSMDDLIKCFDSYMLPLPEE